MNRSAAVIVVWIWSCRISQPKVGQVRAVRNMRLVMGRMVGFLAFILCLLS